MTRFLSSCSHSAARTTFVNGALGLGTKIVIKSAIKTSTVPSKGKKMDTKFILYSKSDWQHPEAEKQQGTAAFRGTPSATGINIFTCSLQFKSQVLYLTRATVRQRVCRGANWNYPAFGGLLIPKWWRDKERERMTWTKPEFLTLAFYFLGYLKENRRM